MNELWAYFGAGFIAGFLVAILFFCLFAGVVFRDYRGFGYRM